MSSPNQYRTSSYYKDSYDTMQGKRFHSASGSGGQSSSSSHYYDGPSDDRHKRRPQASSRYSSSGTAYPHNRSSNSSYLGSKSASYYDGTSHYPHRAGKTNITSPPVSSSASSLQPLFRSSNDSPSYEQYRSMNTSSSAKYMESSSSRRYDDLRSSQKFSLRRIPPPLSTATGGGSSGAGGGSSSYSSRSKNGSLQPLMKVSVDNSNKEYGSRYRQAPPEHQHHRDRPTYKYSSNSLPHGRTEVKQSVVQPPVHRPVSYCRVCELNFRTDPTEHEKMEKHNEIKALIYQRCDVCDIDFRIWKVYLYHMAALEHAKRVAMRELQERESKEDNVKGTNLSQEELGLDLVHQRTVFYCNACIRYIPIKDNEEESKMRHCMTFTHIKYVDEFNEKERKYREKRARDDEKKAAAASVDEGLNNAGKCSKYEENPDDMHANNEDDGATGESVEEGDGKTKSESLDNSNATYPEDDQAHISSKIKIEAESPTLPADTDVTERDEADDNETSKNELKDEEGEGVEIELHAEVDDDGVGEDSSEDATWVRRTRSSSRKSSKGPESIN